MVQFLVMQACGLGQERVILPDAQCAASPLGKDMRHSMVDWLVCYLRRSTRRSVDHKSEMEEEGKFVIDTFDL